LPPSKSREMSTEQVKRRVGNPRMKPKKGTSTPRPPSPSPLPPVDQEPLTGARKEVRLKHDAVLPPHSATDVKLTFHPTLSHNDLYFQSRTDFASSVHLQDTIFNPQSHSDQYFSFINEGGHEVRLSKGTIV
ncbi:hypothetical protein BT69DRAFT_1287452, partial [Atractiella rhizophila]